MLFTPPPSKAQLVRIAIWRLFEDIFVGHVDVYVDVVDHIEVDNDVIDHVDLDVDVVDHIDVDN